MTNIHTCCLMGFPDGRAVKKLSANAGDVGLIPRLGREDPLEQEMATHSRNLAWKIPWKRSWAATVHGGPKESDMIEHTHTYAILLPMHLQIEIYLVCAVVDIFFYSIFFLSFVHSTWHVGP